MTSDRLRDVSLGAFLLVLVGLWLWGLYMIVWWMPLFVNGMLGLAIFGLGDRKG